MPSGSAGIPARIRGGGPPGVPAHGGVRRRRSARERESRLRRYQSRATASTASSARTGRGRRRISTRRCGQASPRSRVRARRPGSRDCARTWRRARGTPATGTCSRRMRWTSDIGWSWPISPTGRPSSGRIHSRSNPTNARLPTIPPDQDRPRLAHDWHRPAPVHCRRGSTWALARSKPESHRSRLAILCHVLACRHLHRYRSEPCSRSQGFRLTRRSTRTSRKRGPHPGADPRSARSVRPRPTSLSCCRSPTSCVLFAARQTSVRQHVPAVSILHAGAQE